jgi:RimJ/RimL family protein N-acetyltransferase
VGCGAFRKIDPITGEIKRMYVVPSFRGTKVGHRLLTELERRARQYGLCRLVLHTGVRQPEAIRLYRRSGFTRTPPFRGSSSFDVRVGMAKAIIPCVPAEMWVPGHLLEEYPASFGRLSDEAADA